MYSAMEDFKQFPLIQISKRKKLMRYTCYAVYLLKVLHSHACIIQFPSWFWLLIYLMCKYENAHSRFAESDKTLEIIRYASFIMIKLLQLKFWLFFLVQFIRNLESSLDIKIIPWILYLIRSWNTEFIVRWLAIEEIVEISLKSFNLTRARFSTTLYKLSHDF